MLKKDEGKGGREEHVGREAPPGQDQAWISLPSRLEMPLGSKLLSAHRGLHWFEERLRGPQGQGSGSAVGGSQVAEALGHQSS